MAAPQRMIPGVVAGRGVWLGPWWAWPLQGEGGTMKLPRIEVTVQVGVGRRIKVYPEGGTTRERCLAGPGWCIDDGMGDETALEALQVAAAQLAAAVENAEAMAAPCTAPEHPAAYCGCSYCEGQRWPDERYTLADACLGCGRPTPVGHVCELCSAG